MYRITMNNKRAFLSRPKWLPPLMHFAGTLLLVYTITRKWLFIELSLDLNADDLPPHPARAIVCSFALPVQRKLGCKREMNIEALTTYLQ